MARTCANLRGQKVKAMSGKLTAEERSNYEDQAEGAMRVAGGDIENVATQRAKYFLRLWEAYQAIESSLVAERKRAEELVVFVEDLFDILSPAAAACDLALARLRPPQGKTMP